MNSRDKSGWISFSHACNQGHKDVVKSQLDPLDHYTPNKLV